MWWVLLVYDPYPVILTVLKETTPGVYQASGYGDIASDKSIWFVIHLIGSLFYLWSTTGSGSLPHAKILRTLPSSLGSMAV
jgi:hypothetical protein